MSAQAIRDAQAVTDRRDVEEWLQLADELTDGDVPWVENDWDADSVAAARRAASRLDLPFPPAEGDLDRARQGDFGPALAR
jgi:hypothetical protein